MKHEGKEKKDFSRRDFIKTTAVGVGAAALAGLKAEDAHAQTGQRIDNWDRETDVVVVGYGGAGAVAAITAHDAGAKVLVLEKAPVEGGGSTRMAGGQTAYIEAADAAGAAEYLYTGCLGMTPMDVCRAWAEEIANNGDWLTEMGIKWAAFGLPGGGLRGGGPPDGGLPDGELPEGGPPGGELPEGGRSGEFKNYADFQNFPGADALKLLMITGGGPAFFESMNQHIRNRGIEILFDTPGTDLIQNPDTKEILGVIAANKGKNMNIKARRAVVLCSGGFGFNEEMKNNYIRPYPVKFVGWKYNTGDGIKMAQAVGADLWHMNTICSAGQTFVSPASDIGWMYAKARGDSFIWVDRYGRRFACESPAWFDHRASMGYDIWDWSAKQKDARYPCIPFYLIFDEKTRLAGPIGGGFGSQMGALSIPEALGGISEPWSEDNSREVSLGWVKKENTIRELAAAIGGEIDPAVLEKTVTGWNESCETGQDPDFGRKSKLMPIDTPPFYGVEMYPGGFSTCGGPRKNVKSQVLDTKKKPIPRLYTAGSLGSTAAHIYCLAGHNWAEFMAFGRIAGRNAAAEKPWNDE